MKRPILAALMLGGAATLAQAQTPVQPGVETVYSDAQLAADRDLSRRFVQGMLAPFGTFENQYAKWKRPVCLNVYGMREVSKYVIEQRIREVARQVGAPVDRHDPCVPNVTIVVTPEPQVTLDSIAAAAPFLVIGGRKRQLTVTQPIQSWYTTFRRDYSGLAQLDLPWDDAATAGGSASPGTLIPPQGDSTLGIATGIDPDVPRVRSQGTRLSTGITSEMAGVVIIVDSQAIIGITLGTLGDYLALLALAPAPVTGRCQTAAPTIANLMADCAGDVKTTSISNVDIAMLTGLYQTPEKPEMIQKARIIGAMRRNLEAQFAR